MNIVIPHIAAIQPFKRQVAFFEASVLWQCGAVGATTGGLVGNHATEHDPKGTSIGAPTGAAFGALLGYLGYKDARRKEHDREAKLSAFLRICVSADGSVRKLQHRRQNRDENSTCAFYPK